MTKALHTKWLYVVLAEDGFKNTMSLQMQLQF